MKPSNESVPRNDSGPSEELPSFPLEEISLDVSNLISQEDIDLFGDLLSQSEAEQPEDMVRPDLQTAKTVPVGERFSPRFWEDLLESEDVKEPSLALEAEISGAGECRAMVSSVAGQCELAPHHQYWHVSHGKSGLHISLQFSNLGGGLAGDGLEFIVRAVLFRKQSEYRRFPVNRVCSRHHQEFPESDLAEHVLRARDEADGAVYSTAKEGPRRSVSFPCQGPDETGEIRRDISLVFCCLSSCDTTETRDPTYHNREAAQDLTLVITLETRQNIREPFRVLARTNIDVWPKQTVNSRDLNKPQRMLPKGGRAQKRNFQEELDRFGKKTAEEAKRKKLTLRQVLDSIKNNW